MEELMPIDPNREAEARDLVERQFADMERALGTTNAGILDVLRVYGGLDEAMRQVDAYLTLLNPTTPNFTTTSSSNIQR
jgi:hypothetical protein